MTKTETQAYILKTPEAYILKTPDGWAVELYGVPDTEDGRIIPLPWTWDASYEEVVAAFRASVTGSYVERHGIIDGWPTVDSLLRDEPSLAAAVGWPVGNRRRTS